MCYAYAACGIGTTKLTNFVHIANFFLNLSIHHTETTNENIFNTASRTYAGDTGHRH